MTDQPRAGMISPDGQHHRGSFATAVRQHFPWLADCERQRKERGPTLTRADVARQDTGKQDGPR